MRNKRGMIRVPIIVRMHETLWR